MPDPSTTRLALYKSKSDGSELVTYTQDIGQNWDKVDAAAGFQAVTSTTRPSAPFNGKPIRETDTGRMYVSNGSAPASGSWLELATPGTAQTFTQGLTVTGLSLLVEGSASSSTVYRARVAGDTQSRLLITGDGKLTLGSGSAVGDVNLYRSGANVLATDDSLTVAGDLFVQGHDRGRGIVAKILRNTATSGFTTAEVVVMTIPSMTWVNGRAYRINTFGYFQSSLTTGYLYLRFRKGSASTSGTLYADMLRFRTLDTFNATDIPVAFGLNLVNTSGADITTAVTLTASAQSGTMIWNNPAAATYITVEDIGLATDWAGAAIS